MLHVSARRLLASIVLLIGTAGCGGARRIALPTDAGTPFADFARVHEQVSQTCRDVRTLRAVLSLGGRAGDQQLRGTVHAGFETPASMRLELRFGPTSSLVFLLVANDSGATFWWAREERVVRDADAAAIVDAVTGLRLGPRDLQAILTGCVVAEPKATSGRLHGNGWASIALEDGATIYLQRRGDAWRVRAGARGDLRVEYPEWTEASAFPRRVEMHTDTPVKVDLRATLSQVETNTAFPAGAFTTAGVPPSTPSMTIEELRDAGPLRQR